MAKAKYKLQKVFDCQDMPSKICQLLLENYVRNGERHNNSYLEWTPGEFTEDEEIIENWLLNNGMTMDDKEILIQLWW